MSHTASSTRSPVLRAVSAVAILLAALLVAAPPAGAVSDTVVISQVYGGGGNTGAPYTHDFVELFNRGTTTVSLTGWSIQYASATGTGNFGSTTTTITPLSGSLAAGQYLLVQEASTAAVGAPLPTPDVTDSSPIAMGATAGKVALVNTTTPLGCNGGSTPCSPGALASIVDLVGWGNANFFEGSGPAPATTNTTAAIRAAAACTETDNNAADFSPGTPTPRNTASPLNPCATTDPTMSIDDVSMSEGDAGTTTFAFTVSLSAPAAAGGVTFDVATADNTASAPGDYTANTLTGQAIPAGSSTYTFSVLVNGDVVTEPDETFFVNVTNVTGAAVADGQGLGTILNDEAASCGQPFTPINQIQGSGLSAAITGDLSTEGVVVGDFEGTSRSQGFYLQDLAGDADATTSDGIFVFTGAADLVSVGDVVRVTGFARERFSQTTINGSNSNTSVVPAGNIIACGAGSVPATDVAMPFASATFPERYEGMLVRFPQPLVISEYFNYDQFGEIVLALPLDGEPRPFSGTAVDAPGAAANARTLANSLRRITLDDAQSASNPSVLRHPDGGPFSLGNRFRGGDLVQNTTGVLGFDFNLYRVVPTAPADYTGTNPRPVAPEPVGGSVRAAAMNTLNFFVTPDYPTGDPRDNACGPAQNVECRGADFDQPSEFTRQRDKLLAALSGLNGDVIGLNELENTTGVDPLGDPTGGVVPGLNALLGAGTFDYIDTGTIGTDAIRVGLIYKPAAVTPVGAFKVLTSAVDPRFVDTRSRPTLAQTFQVNATGARFTVAVNHLKSKGSACTGDPDAGDGQGNCNGTRTLAAQALVDWLATDPTASGDPDFLILGDLNSYAKEDPITAIRAGSDDVAGTGDDFTNLIADYQGAFAYSYTFDGQAGYLDHALANPSMAAQVTAAADWHINSDEPDVVDYDTSFKPPAQEALYEQNPYRSSDHDPVVVGLNPVNAAPVATSQSVSTAEDTPVAITLAASDAPGTSLTYTVVSGPSNGTLSGVAPNLTYSPNTNFNGSDSFTFKANDGYSDSNVATVAITVTPVNDAPVAVADASTTRRGTAVTINVLANDTDVDGDVLTVTAVTQGSNGSVRIVNGQIRYGPKENFKGTDTFTYTVSDGHGGTATATVTVTVTK